MTALQMLALSSTPFIIALLESKGVTAEDTDVRVRQGLDRYLLLCNYETVIGTNGELK